MIYAFILIDKPDSAALRQRVRPEHKAYLAAVAERIAFAGPFMNFEFSSLRLLGVLQRYALVYPLVSMAYLRLDWRRLLAGSAVLLVAYWALLAWVHVPGFGHPQLLQLPQGQFTPNIATWLDLKLLRGVIGPDAPYDPEGILSTLPAIVTMVLGVVAGQWIRRSEVSPEARINRLFAWGVILTAAGYFWGFAFPLSKKLWSSSFVLFMGGWSLLAFAALYWAVDLKGRAGRWSEIPRWFGMNAVASIVVFTFIDNVMSRLPIRRNGPSFYVLKDFLNDYLFRSWLPARHASWVYSVVAILLLSLLFRGLDRRKWYLRV